MPLSHNQSQDKLPFVSSDSFTFPFYNCNEVKLKRKLEPNGTFDQMEAMENWREEQTGGTKRLCLDQGKESHNLMSQPEDLPGCLKEMSMPPTAQSNMASHGHESQIAPSEMNGAIFDMEEDPSNPHPIDSTPGSDMAESGAHGNEGEGMSDLGGASMETDFVPDCQQYTAPSPHDTHTSKGAYCGCITCNGLKQSPVTGRMHCHCHASWRGMYGIDCSFNSDYY